MGAVKSNKKTGSEVGAVKKKTEGKEKKTHTQEVKFQILFFFNENGQEPRITRRNVGPDRVSRASHSFCFSENSNNVTDVPLVFYNKL